MKTILKWSIMVADFTLILILYIQPKMEKGKNWPSNLDPPVTII